MRRDEDNPFEFIFKELENMANNMSVFRSPDGRIMGGISIIPSFGSNQMQVDVNEHDDEVIVVADLPGVDREAIEINLINPRVLGLKCTRDKESEREDDGYYVRERVSGTTQRTIALPCDVKSDGTTATFKNGVLEVKLKKQVVTDAPTIKITGE